MNIKEAIQALEDGKKIRKCRWIDKKFYIQLNENNQIIDLKGDPMSIWAESLADDEWELYEIEYFDFFEAMKRLKDGKKVSNYDDVKNFYVIKSGSIKHIVSNATYEASFSTDKVSSNKWFEVE